MLDWVELERSGLVFQVYLTPYGHAEITFGQGFPFNFHFVITLSKKDLKKILKLLSRLDEEWEVEGK